MKNISVWKGVKILRNLFKQEIFKNLLSEKNYMNRITEKVSSFPNFNWFQKAKQIAHKKDLLRPVWAIPM